MPNLSDLRIRNFSGGLNLRDAVAEIAPTESPDLWNVTFDERGGVAKRLGQSKWNGSVFAGGAVSNVFYSPTLGDKITQTGTKLTLGTTTTVRHTFSTSARAGFADFNGAVYAIHPADGLLNSTDGVTWSAVSGGPDGSFLIPWQGRLVALGDPSHKPRLYASGIGDGTDWTTTAGHGWTNDLRELDSEVLVSAAVAPGMDISGRGGLLVFKNGSYYRVYDSSNGSYVTVDPQVGANSALAVVTLYGQVMVMGRGGIYTTNGTTPLSKVSAKVDPLFRADALATAHLDLCCAGWLDDRVYFSFPRTGSTVNDICLEYHPIEGWISAGSNAASCYATDLNDTQKLYGGSPSVSGQVYEMFNGGSDDGADIESWFQTQWFEPSSGFLTRMLRLLPVGRGNFTLFVKTDYTVGQGTSYDVEISRGGFVWNDPGSTWNLAGQEWGPTVYEAYADPIPSPGVCRSVAIRVAETSSTVMTAPPLLGTGVAPQVGAWALGGCDLQYVQLGTA